MKRPRIQIAGISSQAIRAVRPWGVDVHTGVERPDGTFDPDRAAAFVTVAVGVPA